MSIEEALANLDVDRFWERGYAILPDVYTPEEIAQIRQQAYDSRGQGGDLLANPRLQHVLTDGRMAAVATKLLGTQEIFYGGDSSFTINGTQRGWHKDNTDRNDPAAPDWESRYTQLRFGIYCQDHVTHTGGLNLRVGSHDIPNLTGGECLYVKTKPGDLAVWSMRITHSGNGTLLKDPAARYPEPGEFDKIDPADMAPADGDRIAIFAHLGADDSHAKRYCDYLKTRTYMVNAWRKRPYSDDDRAAAEKAGLILRDMPAEVIGDPSAGLNEKWQAFAYDKPAAATAGAAPGAPGSAPGTTYIGHAPAAPATPVAGGSLAGGPPAGEKAKRVAKEAARRGLAVAKGAARGGLNAWKQSKR